MKKGEVQFQDGEVIFREGDASQGVYALVDGTVELSKEGERGTVVLGVRKAGETFGEMGIFDGSPRSTTARAIGAVTARLIPHDEFVAAIRNEPETALRIMVQLIGRLRSANDLLARGGGTGMRAERAAGRGRLRILDRLLGLHRRAPGGEPRPERLEIRVAPLAGDPDLASTRQVAAAFEKRPAVRAKTLKKPLEIEPSPDPTARILATAAAARQALAEAEADLLLWGEVGESGTTLRLRFVPAQIEDEDRFGCFGLVSALDLPVAFSPPLAEILYAVSLAAATPSTNGKTITVREVLPRALEAMLPIVRSLPGDLTSRERASIQACFANLAAAAARQAGAAELYHIAAQNYRDALDGITAAETPQEWAMVQRNLGVMLQALAERGRDAEILGKSVECYRNALGVLDRAHFPREWAAVQNRLGVALYKLDLTVDDSDNELVKQALGAYQAALQIYSRAEAPMRWAEVMNNIGQAAQLLGGQLRNAEVAEKAAEACRGALEVRTRERAPLLWAASQNNLGSALFLLGKLTGDPAHLENAAEAFRQAHALYTAYGARRMIAITEKNLAHVQGLLESQAPKRTGARSAWEEAIDESDEGAHPASPVDRP